MNVAMLLSNPYWPDLRVQKEAHSLALAGHRVWIVAWDRQRQFAAHETERIPIALDSALADWPERNMPVPFPVTIVRIRVSAGFRTGQALLRKVPPFWWMIFQKLRHLKPDVIHAHDFDTLPIAFLYHSLTGARLIYDAHEYYAGMVRANVGARISDGLDAWERALAPRADAVVTVGSRLAARFRSVRARTWIVLNSQPPMAEADVAKLRDSTRKDLGLPPDALVVVYVGYLSPNRLLMPMIEAVEARDDVWFVIGGTGPQFDCIQRHAERCSRIKLLGWVSVDDVAAIVAGSDVVYYGLDPANRNSYYFMPNLAFFALAAGRPLLTTPVGEIAEFTRGLGTGVVARSLTSGAALELLDRLRNVTYRETLGHRARYIHQTQYNWANAATQLIEAYRSC